MAFPPPSSIALTTAEAALASFAYVMATLAPSAARRFAIAAPIPREPPVTSATFFANLDIKSPLLSGERFATPLIHLTDCVHIRAGQTVLNRSVLYDDGGASEDAEILNYLVLYW